MTEADRRFRKNLVAVCLVAAPLLIGIGELIASGLYDGDDEAKYLANIAENETRYYVGNMVSIAGAFCLPIAMLGLAHLVRVRKRIFGTIAGAVALVAAFGMPGAWLGGTIIEYIAAQQSDRVAMAALLKDMESDAAIPIFIVWIGFMLGLILLGIGLMLARTVPRWMGAGVIVSVVALFMSEGDVGTAIASAVIVAAWGAIGWSIWKRTPAQWENGELPDGDPAVAHASPAPAGA